MKFHKCYIELYVEKRFLIDEFLIEILMCMWKISNLSLFHKYVKKQTIIIIELSCFGKKKPLKN